MGGTAEAASVPAAEDKVLAGGRAEILAGAVAELFGDGEKARVDSSEDAVDDASWGGRAAEEVNELAILLGDDKEVDVWVVPPEVILVAAGAMVVRQPTDCEEAAVADAEGVEAKLCLNCS